MDAGTIGASERLARLRLARSEGVGPKSFTRLLARFGTAAEALDALPALAGRGGRSDYRACPEDAALAEIAAGEAAGARLVLFGEPAYPQALATIPTPPPALWVRGDRDALARAGVAVVGARNASALGARFARRLGRGLATAGEVVVSGLARGIDAAAHEGALEGGTPEGDATGGGTTVAVLAGGVDVVYPPEHTDLAARIADRGALVSECPPGTEPTSRHFPRRNRLISGLARAVVLVEAAARSGSLLTARAALEQGREVMACPGSPDDARAGGCNALIRDGALLIRGHEDVLDALGGPLAPCPAPVVAPLPEPSIAPAEGDDALAARLMALIGAAPVEVDELARRSGASPAALSLALLELDLAGRIERLAGERVMAAGP
ncbi:MAG: DNA-processing protein DprA [Paracoccaceae bacterium]